jgi:hypothetical protein
VSSSGDFSFGDERELELKGLSGIHRVSLVIWSGEETHEEANPTIVPASDERPT